MSVEYVGIKAGTLVNPLTPNTGVRFRATFVRTAGEIVLAGITPIYDAQDYLRMAQQNVINGVTSQQIGFVFAQSPIGPSDAAFSVDLRLSSSRPTQPAAALAESLDGLSSFVNLTRLQIIAAGEGAEAASENRSDTAGAAQTKSDPLNFFSDLYAKLQGVGKVFLVVLVIAAALLVWYYLPRKGSK